MKVFIIYHFVCMLCMAAQDIKELLILHTNDTYTAVWNLSPLLIRIRVCGKSWVLYVVLP